MSNHVVSAVVVANGGPPDPAIFGALLRAADIVVAADGGACVLIEQDLPLTTIVGDLDSLPPALLDRWQARGGDVRRYPREKDETDLELAVTEALRRGARRVAILGALGGRVDHQTANLLLLAHPFLDGIDAAVLDVGARVVAVKDAVTLAGRPGDLLSLLPVTSLVEGISATGLRYPLVGESLKLGSPRGVSNVFTARQATVRVRTGTLLVMQTWTDTRPVGW